MRAIEVFNDTMNFVYAFVPKDLVLIILSALAIGLYYSYKEGKENDQDQKN